MTNEQIDKFLGQTPCLCGDVTTWHKECYVDKTPEEVERLYKGVYSKLRRSWEAVYHKTESTQ